MTHTRVSLGGYCPSFALRFAIVSRGSLYLTTKEIPLQWDADIKKAVLWDHRLDAENFLKLRLSVGNYKYRVVEVTGDT